MEYIAHKSNDGRIQTVKEHLLQTATLSRGFAVDELKEICYLLGLLHDVGKYQRDFQRRINGENVRVDHSICGALEIEKTKLKGQALGLLFELCIMGHHTGLPNCSPDTETNSLKGRLKYHENDDYSAYKKDIEFMTPEWNVFNQFICTDCKSRKELIEKFAFVVRYCFSCLTDADSIDTMDFEGLGKKQEINADFEKCLSLLDNKLSSFLATTNVQRARSALGAQAINNIDDAEIFLMNMPTGSGKTLASMRCALQMAKNYHLKRIIYVIPYNSIIDQTAQVFENLFGKNGNVLRHQSSFIYEEQEDLNEDYIYSAQKACENWDADIIITTVVQFFESLYGNKRGKLRKVHNMAESIIVFDEAHLMPREYLQPCLSGIGYIGRLLHSKILFLTATMPDYKRLLEKYSIPSLKITELIKDKSSFIQFKNVNYHYLDVVTDEKLISMISKVPSCLVVMNSRKGAQEIFSICSGDKYHLSTYMTAYDREKTIAQIKEALTKLYEDYEDLSLVPNDRKIVVVSTSLIEAGVDLDFAEAYRELSGLDNILQTGGRCNREGKREKENIYVFRRSEKNILKINQTISKGIFSEFEDISSPEAIAAYYDRLLFMENDILDKKAVSASCENIDQIDFRTYSEKFNLIDGSRVVSIVVIRDSRSQELHEQLKINGHINPREVQKYCCSVYQNEFESLLQQGVVEDYGSGIFFLTNMDYYDPKTGIKFEGNDFYL